MSQLELLTTNGYDQLLKFNKIFNVLTKKELKAYVLLSLKDLQGEPDERVSTEADINKYSAIRELIKHITRLKTATNGDWNVDEIKSFLNGLKFSEECVSELCKIICNSELYTTLPLHLVSKPILTGLKWKIDISLCQTEYLSQEIREENKSSILHKNLTVILLLHFDSGITVAQRFSMAQFHNLRYIVAALLKNVLILEQRKCIKRVATSK